LEDLTVYGRFVLSLVFALIVAIFALQNANTVDINFLYMHIAISQALIILISAIIGAITVLFPSVIRSFKLKKKIKEAGKAIAALKEENEQLKQALDTEKSKTPAPSDQTNK